MTKENSTKPAFVRSWIPLAAARVGIICELSPPPQLRLQQPAELGPRYTFQ